MALKEIEITILNWEKYNPRRDVKNSSWFRLQHDLFEDHEFFQFDHSELCVWIYILSLASKKNSPKVILYGAHANRIGRFSDQTILSALEKLNEIKAITLKHVTYAARTRHVTGTDTVRSRALRNETRRDVTEQEEESYGLSHDQPGRTIAGPIFDFGAIYDRYPKRKGSQRKSDGLRFCQKRIQTPEEYENLKKSVENYRAHCEREQQIGTQYVSQFKTFVTSIWEEWIAPPELPLITHAQGNSKAGGWQPTKSAFENELAELQRAKDGLGN